MDQQEERGLIGLAQAGDRVALATLMTANRHLERKVARRLNGKWKDALKEKVAPKKKVSKKDDPVPTDLELMAREGLYAAIMNYDLHHDTKPLSKSRQTWRLMIAEAKKAITESYHRVVEVAADAGPRPGRRWVRPTRRWLRDASLDRPMSDDHGSDDPFGSSVAAPTGRVATALIGGAVNDAREYAIAAILRNRNDAVYGTKKERIAARKWFFSRRWGWKFRGGERRVVDLDENTPGTFRWICAKLSIAAAYSAEREDWRGGFRKGDDGQWQQNDVPDGHTAGADEFGLDPDEFLKKLAADIDDFENGPARRVDKLIGKDRWLNIQMILARIYRDAIVHVAAEQDDQRSLTAGLAPEEERELISRAKAGDLVALKRYREAPPRFPVIDRPLPDLPRGGLFRFPRDGDPSRRPDPEDGLLGRALAGGRLVTREEFVRLCLAVYPDLLALGRANWTDLLIAGRIDEPVAPGEPLEDRRREVGKLLGRIAARAAA